MAKIRSDETPNIFNFKKGEIMKHLIIIYPKIATIRTKLHYWKFSGKEDFCFDKKHPFHASVKENIRVTSSEHFQETRLVKFDIISAENKLAYQPGDVVMIMPSNLKENVDEFLGL